MLDDQVIPFSGQQLYVCDMIVRGKTSIFFTGPPGSGKTSTLEMIIEKLGGLGPTSGVYCTAATGIAASLISGSTTLHRFAGVGLGVGEENDLVRKAQKILPTRKRWKTCSTLIIDEISMVSPRFFQLLDKIAKNLRKSNQPFGGIQLVLVGDFFQLPPVKNVSEPAFLDYRTGQEAIFCFQTRAWDDAIKDCVALTQNFRTNSSSLVSLLNNIRSNSIELQDLDLLKTLSRPLPEEHGIVPTCLYGTNRNVENINFLLLKSCTPENEQVFKANDSGRCSEMLQTNCPFVDELCLRVGAQVMCVKNLPEKNLVNGSRGVVVTLELHSIPVGKKSGRGRCITRVYPRVQFRGFKGAVGPSIIMGFETFHIEDPSTGATLALREQLPLRLAWALTIHKSQGMSIDFVKIDLQDVFADGQAYVALSRARSIDGLMVLGANRELMRISETVGEFYKDKVRPAPTVFREGEKDIRRPSPYLQFFKAKTVKP